MKAAKYITAQWCQPCKVFKPIIQELISEGYNIQIIDIDQNRSLAEQYGIRSVPTTIIEENGRVVNTVIGIRQKDEMKQLLS